MFYQNLPRGFIKLTEKIFFTKFFHTTSLVQNGSLASLAKLRKATGYSMSNCKKALQLHPDNLSLAEEWLHKEAKKEGWSKIANLQNRTAAQGLVGVYADNNVGAMVEVNCETDFVAKNSDFQLFVEKILSSCINHTPEQIADEDCRKILLDGESVNELRHESLTLENLLASAVGKFGEKIAIRRAVCFKTGNDVQLSSFSHPLTMCQTIQNGGLGKYGGLVAFRSKERVDQSSVSELGYQLSQHVVGMNPQSLGEYKEEVDRADEDDSKTQEETSTVEEQVPKVEVGEIMSEEKTKNYNTDTEQEEEHTVDQGPKLKDANETCLLRQQFLHDPSVSVGRFLKDNELEILDFQRFECGESSDNSN